ncbi:polysaccharide deacetylase family protein [Salisediminibacterium halotolerans]|uniref:Peptidoglycan/xylan/chitin deacetylase, PgdA/CDA1 family n=1 Tax=Salisediminibacterium halotolerans TaxID=517425 RepID=A0A1H9UWJ3_9BACI|nr:polysaccharide deacetylase family protein [Salisediminibacterium haloalkalitolerans]SES13709.1 Peptidoglycan/xylan/chitin deacetylase, PgdA/CDA1 family [Salisediminibacterium haloalkalitolerans]
MKMRLWITAAIFTAVSAFFIQTYFSSPSEKYAAFHSAENWLTDQSEREKSDLQDEPADRASEVLATLSEHDHDGGEFGVHIDGVKNRFETNEQEIALTFDLCGGDFGSELDEELVDFLRDEQIPAVLFVNKRWLTENEEQFIDLYEDPLFTIENHGTEHKPLSVEGKEGWGIDGTGSPEEAVEEVMINQQAIYERTGYTPELFRSGTAHVDESSVALVNRLGLETVNYDILGDAGATYSAEEVKESLLNAEAGSIALLHMNQPNSETAAGVQKAVPELQADGYEFVALDNKTLVD